MTGRSDGGASGEALGPYLLEREIASGGMATVYRAVRIDGDGARRPVAIKRIHPHLARDADFVAMFLDEARLVARIDHPNVCAVIESGRQDGSSFLVMELLEGCGLGTLLAALARRERRGSAHVRLVVTLLVEAAEGLHAAHELRDADGLSLEVVHRDVSPQNLFVTRDGVCKVIDFGVASARDKSHRTETGEFKGKLAYAAPEQLMGRADRRADVWSLGVVLWEALTLERLFRRPTPPETMTAVDAAPIPSPSAVRPDLTAAFDAATARALDRSMESRWPTARALATALTEVLAGLGGPIPLAERAAVLVELTGTHPIVPDERTPPQTPATVVSHPAATKVAAAGFAPTAGGTERRRGPMGVAVVIGLAAVVATAAIAFRGPRRETPSPTPTESAPLPPLPTSVAQPLPTAPSAPVPEAVAPAPPVSTARRAPTPAPPAEVAPAPEPHRSGEVAGAPARVVVPAGVAVCFDAPCADRSEATFGPRTLMLPSGEHAVHYVSPDGEDRGPAVTLGHGVVTLVAGEVVRVPRP